MSALARRDAGLVAALGVVGIAFVAAVVSQQVYDIQPCPWCVLQRLVFAAIGAAALLGLGWRGALGARVGAAAIAVLAGCGIAAALWQYFVAARSPSCALTFADQVMNATGLNVRIPDLFMAYASCADAEVRLWGVPYEFFSLLLFAAATGAAWHVWRSGQG